LTIGIRRFLNHRLGRTLAIAAIVAVAWEAWWLWPPQPEYRLQLPSPGRHWWGQVAPDGQTFALQYSESPREDESSIDQIDLFDLRNSQRITTIHNTDKEACFAPDGSRFACHDARGHWHLYGRSPFERLAEFSGAKASKAEWLRDSRHFIITENDHIDVYNADRLLKVASIHKTHAEHLVIPDASGLVAASPDGKTIDVWKFDPPRVVESMKLPYPPADPDDLWSKSGPEPGSMGVHRLAVSHDGSVVAMLINRYEPKDEGLAAISYVEHWDRTTKRITELSVGGQSIPGGSATFSIDPSGRFVSHERWYAVGDFITPDWERYDSENNNKGRLWDFSVSPPKCRDSALLPSTGSVMFDPTGARLIVHDHPGVTLFDTKTFSRIANAGNRPDYSRGLMTDGRWMVALSEFSLPNWWPSFVTDIVKQLYKPEDPSLTLVRMSDGKLGRIIPGRGFSAFTSDGKLWTCSYSEPGPTGQTAPVILERWSPEPPTPWWLLALTGLAVMLVLRNHGLPHFKRVAAVPS
jgi:hypothetical protein